MELAVEPNAGPRRAGVTGFLLGLASLALLGASVRWAHHWNPRAVAVVAAWAAATVGAAVLCCVGLRGRRRAKGFAAYGIVFVVLDLAALALAGVASAAGDTLPGPCGGG